MTTTQTEVQRYAEMAIEQAIDLHNMVTFGDLGAGNIEEEYGLDPSESGWLDLLDVMALEVYGNAQIRSTETQLQSVTVVTGTGGPHVEFTVDHNDRVTGFAIWGSDKAEAYDTLSGLFDALAPLVDPSLQ